FVGAGGGGPPPPPPVLTTITVTPNPANVATGGTQQFTAQGSDQNGNPIAASFSWSASGGSIDGNGLYSATTQGTFTVTASSGSVSGNATVNVGAASTEVIVDDLDPGFHADSGSWTIHYTPGRYASTNRRIASGTTGVAGVP